MNLPMQADEVRAFVKRTAITIRENDWTGMWKTKTDRKRRTLAWANDAERKKAQVEQSKRWKAEQKRGICDCDKPATVRTSGGFACDSCLRLERQYYDSQHRRRRIGGEVCEEAVLETCDCCGETVGTSQATVETGGIYCEKCREKEKE